ncbi:MAG: hypothetical protein AM324_014320 [Candidatus Thorarchaeota archaeon SMTZ1-83]|nr:MAG: hypothetical protein AM324_15445 [Candidatus Thorarchaeota archaeon SMTZ1-83]
MLTWHADAGLEQARNHIVRNLLGGLIGSVVGAGVLAILLAPHPVAYPSPFDNIWVLLVGCENLQQSVPHLLDPNTAGSFLASWLVIGVVVAPFSKSYWNAVRTSVWVGVVIGIVSLSSILIVNPAFWTSATRNWDLVVLFSTSIIVGLLSLVAALPLVKLISLAQSETKLPPPESILTTCECGAVFKSRPLLCSECGRQLSKRE